MVLWEQTSEERLNLVFLLALIAKSVENIVYYKRHVIASAEFDSSQNIINVMYSSFALHGAPISLNLVTNSILKGLAGPDFSIATANAPLRINSKSSPSLFLEIKVGLAWTVLLPLGKFEEYCKLMMAIHFLVFCEEQSKLKQFFFNFLIGHSSKDL